MSSQVGLWIDHRRAFVVYFEGETTSSKEILSNIEEEVRAAGGSRSATRYEPQEQVGESRVDRKFQQHLEKYYDQVAKTLQDARSVLILGPGQAKDEFKKHLQQSKKKPQPTIAVETTDKMTDAQVIQRVKKHYIH